MTNLFDIIQDYAEVFFELYEEKIKDAIVERLPKPDIDEIVDRYLETEDTYEMVANALVEYMRNNI